MPDELKTFFEIWFNDAATFDPETKTVISIRDGVQRYRGHEVGLEPSDRIFTFYRSPESIKDIVDMLDGLPVTTEHVSLDDPVPENVTVGKIVNGEVLEYIDNDTDSTVKVKNKITLDKETGNSQLSLGYKANVIDCDKYDFEQVNLAPKHLAIVQKGRCGEACKFIDKEMEGMKKKLDINKAFLDADGAVNMQQVLQLVEDLPNAIKTMPIKDLAKLVPVLQKATSFAAETVAEEVAGPGGSGDEMSEEEKAAAAAAAAAEKEGATDGGGAAAGDDPSKKEFGDTLTPEQKAQKEADDTKAFNDSVAAKVKEQNATYATVMAKAKSFLPDTFNFADQSSDDIMRAALATQMTDKFEDHELPVAFKTLKKQTGYAKFADEDNAATDLDAIGEKEV